MNFFSVAARYRQHSEYHDAKRRARRAKHQRTPGDGSLMRNAGTRRRESMSPTIPILSALLLSLISGSTEGGQRMDSVALLRQTLRYWRKIYKTYHEEVMLGYCWADYLLEISDELSANLSATSFAATGDHSNASVAATKSQQNPFPQNIMVHATPTYEGTRKARKHLREKRSYAASSTIWEFANDSDERQSASSSTIIRKRQKWTIYPTERDAALNDRADQVDENDGNKSTAPMIDFYDEARRHGPTTPKMYHEDEALRGHEFSSRRTSSRAFNLPMSNPPRNDDKVDSRSMNFKEKKEDTRRTVLRPPTTNRGFSKTKGALQSRSFSLKISRGRERRSFDGRRLSIQRCPQLRERNPRADTSLSDPCRMPKVDRGTRRDPGGCQVPLSGYEGIPSRLQFRWINADTDRRRRTGVVKLTDSEGNSSRDLAGPINSRTSQRRKPKELSRNSLLSPREGGVDNVERSIPESRRGGRAAIKRNAFPGVETAEASATRKRCSRSGEEEGSRAGRDVSLVVMCIFCKSGLERTEQKTLYGKRWKSFAAISQESEQRDEQFVPSTRSASLLPLEEFTDDYGNLTSQSARDSRSNALRDRREDRQSPPAQQPSFASTVRSIIIAVFKTLGMFVQVGRQIMDVVESNAALACTKEYLWVKMIKWIDA